MASKRKPLDDARRRLKEKLGAIDEQKEFIQNSVDQLTTEVSCPIIIISIRFAKSLLVSLTCGVAALFP